MDDFSRTRSTVSLLMNRADPGAAVPFHIHQVEETVVMFEGRIWGAARAMNAVSLVLTTPVIRAASVPSVPQACGVKAGMMDVGVWRPRSLCRFHLPRRRTTQAARLTPPMTYPQARGLTGIATMRDYRLGRHDFRFGSKADIPQRNRDVRFTPESGHQLSALGCPLSARSGHLRVSRQWDDSRNIIY
jgi:hypothetical protein